MVSKILSNAIAAAPAGQCKLTYVSATQLKLIPFGGSALTINGVRYTVPSAGVTISNGGLAASTLYYVYAYMSSGVMTLELSTTARATSATSGNAGTEIKSGDDTRSLVGMILTNASSQFSDASATRYTRSWFNDSGVQSSTATSGTVTTTNTSTGVELDTTVRIAVLLWAGEAYAQTVACSCYNSGTGNYTYVGCGTPSSLTGGWDYQCQETANRVQSAGTVYSSAASVDGYLILTIWGLVSAGTGTWVYKNNLVTTQRR